MAMLAYGRAFAVAPSLRLATGGRSIAAPLLRYSTIADAVAVAPTTPASSATPTPTPPTTPAAKSSPTPQGPRPLPARSSSSAPKYTRWAKPQRTVKTYNSGSSPLGALDGRLPSSGSSPALAKDSTTTSPPASTTINAVPPPSAPFQALPFAPNLSEAKYEEQSPEILHWKPNIPLPQRQRPLHEHVKNVDWTTSYHGLGTNPVTPAQFAILCRPLTVSDVEVKPDGILYMPEIRYRRRLNEAFGPMGWGIAPRGEVVVGKEIVTREYALIIDGCFVSQAQGVNNYFSSEGIPQAVEGAKSNALMRCCKDIGIASELWDPEFIRWFTRTHTTNAWVEHTTNKKKRKWFYKKGSPVDLPYPYKLSAK